MAAVLSAFPMETRPHGLPSGRASDTGTFLHPLTASLSSLSAARPGHTVECVLACWVSPLACSLRTFLIHGVPFIVGPGDASGPQVYAACQSGADTFPHHAQTVPSTVDGCLAQLGASAARVANGAYRRGGPRLTVAAVSRALCQVAEEAGRATLPSSSPG